MLKSASTTKPQTSNWGKSPSRDAGFSNPQRRVAASPDRTKALHVSNVKHPEISRFTEITDPNSLNDLPGAKAILDFYKVGSKKPFGQAYNCKDKSHIAVVLKGQQAYEQLFKTGFYTYFGWGRFFGGFNRRVGVAWAKSGVNLITHNDGKLEYSLLKSGLKSGEFKVVVTYEQDPQTGRYSKKPKAIAILDKSKRLCRSILEGVPKDDPKLESLRKKLDAVQHDPDMAATYECSMLLADPRYQKHLEQQEYLQRSATLIAEVCPREWKIVFPGRLFDDSKQDTSLNKNYQVLKWQHLLWQKGKLVAKPGEITLARIKRWSGHKIPENVAFFSGWHGVHEAMGSNIALSTEDIQVLNQAYEANLAEIRKFDQNNS